MIKFFSLVILFLIILFYSPPVLARSNSFVSVVNPVRGDDFWDLKNQQPNEAVNGEAEIIIKANISATWLIRFDALGDLQIINELNSISAQEKGLFLEVTPTWAREAGVSYHQSENWHDAGSALLTGYERDEREKLIDSAFARFKKVFGYYPKSVGAWWIDSYSLDYMQKKYGITAGLIVSDQYTTDNYQIWGQYFSTPYYPEMKNALHPAASTLNKIPVVLTQWAVRDPLNGYGNGVFESTFSVQANDYLDYHKQDINYFIKLVNIYTKQEFNRFGFLTVGLENSYDWSKYKDEYVKQIEVLAKKVRSGELIILPLKDFADWYKSAFPELSPEHLIVADDPLGSDKKVVWFMNPYYRAGWFIDSDGSVFRDLRQYVEGEEELCFKERCDNVNFATSATRVLDEISFGHKWIIDEGRISNFSINKEVENFVIRYQNEAGKIRQIEFLPRDISVDGKVSSIDKAILDATKKDFGQTKNQILEKGFFKWSVVSVLSKIIRFVLFLILACVIPGLVLTYKIMGKNSSALFRIFLSSMVGLVAMTLLFYLVSLLNLKVLILVYFFICFILFIRLKILNISQIHTPKINSIFDSAIFLVIGVGTIFQVIPTFKSGLTFPFGLGFWGPNAHDGVWHIALVNQLIKSIPPQNPVFAGSILKNYHYFYDLLVAVTNYLSKIPVLDLVFRFYPILFSILLGTGTYYLVMNLFKDRIGILNTKVIAIFSLYLVYSAGSFGWIVEYIKERHLGGESAFWANQAISFNLNPPFAISLLMVITLLQILLIFPKKMSGNAIFIASLLSGMLMGFKAYGAVLVLSSLAVVGLLKKQFYLLLIFTTALLISTLIFLSNFEVSLAFLIFAPFWFIHAMIDSPDRVGWTRITLARITAQSLGQWPKFILAEGLSFALFIVGNLGLRIFSLGILLKFKSVIKDTNLLFIFVISLLSASIPVFFIQSGNPWNTIQFFYYFLYICSIISGVVISWLYIKLPKTIFFIVTIIFLILAPINSIATASGYISYQPHAKISPPELEALEFLSKQKNGIVLTYPYNKNIKQNLTQPWSLFAYDSTAYVSAFSQKNVFLEDESQNQILLTDYKKRLVAAKDFFTKPNLEERKFLEENKIKYIYLLKIYSVPLDSGSIGIKLIYNNDEVEIYEVI